MGSTVGLTSGSTVGSVVGTAVGPPLGPSLGGTVEVGEGVTVSLFPHAEIPKMIAVNVNIYSQARKFGLAVYYHSLKASTARESVVEDISKLEAEDLDYFSLLIIRR